MDIELLKMIERCTAILKQLQERVNSQQVALSMLQARQAAFEEACVDSIVQIYDELPRGKAVEHG